MSIIPDYLLAPPDSKVDAFPVVTLLQVLPYEKLTWENFERLCLRLARQRNEVEVCRSYGVKGDAQKGIDIYARAKGHDRYIVYQCKNEGNFGPQKIKDAVNLFLKGDFARNSSEFVLCCRESLNGSQREDAIALQRDALGQNGIALKIWDSAELNIELKQHPSLIVEFFGISWAEKFCGKEAIKNLYDGLPPKNEYPEVVEHIPRNVAELGKDYREFSIVPEEDLLDVVYRNNRIALLGGAGAGKSAELNRVAHALTQAESTWYPFKIYFNTYTDSPIESYISGLDKIPPEIIIVLIDGLDEVPAGHFETARKKILEFTEKYPKAKVLVSCRSNFFIIDTTSTLNGFTPYILRDLSEEDIEEYLERKIGNRKLAFLRGIQERELNTLVKIPFYLNRLTHFFMTKGELPVTKAALFNDIVQESVQDTIRKNFSSDIANKEYVLQVSLERLAFVLECMGKNFASAQEFLSIIPDESERDLLKRCSLLQGGEGKEAIWKFEHNNMQEFLAAKVLSTQNFETIKQLIAFKPSYDRLKPSWTNTLSFLLSLVNNSDPLLKRIFAWVQKLDPEWIVKVEPDRLDEEFRFNVFISIFNQYKKEGRSINLVKYKPEELAHFAESERSLLFLLNEISTNEPLLSRTNAVYLLQYYRQQSIPVSYREQVRLALKENMHVEATDSQLPYLAIRAYINLFELTQPEMQLLLDSFGKSNNAWVRFIINYAIHTFNFQDIFIEYVIQQIKQSHFREYDSKNIRLMDESIHLKKCAESARSEEAIAKLILYYANDGEQTSRTLGSYIYQVLSTATTFFPKSESIFQAVKTLYESLYPFVEGPKMASCIKDYLDQTGSTDRMFEEIFRGSEKRDFHIMLKLSRIATNTAIHFLIGEFRWVYR